MTGRATARINGWDRAAIVILGAAACALSYDALQQMATAIHVRGFLTYLFPLVIDGFIAYGVRALLVMSTAPLTARTYVWTLFGGATAASIWANALHAIRLNQQQSSGAGLRLGDLTVGILSTLAPLALAGSVHLYILIARRTEVSGVPGQPGDRDGRTARVTVTPVTSGRLSGSLADQPGLDSRAQATPERRIGQVTEANPAGDRVLRPAPAPDTQHSRAPDESPAAGNRPAQAARQHLTATSAARPARGPRTAHPAPPVTVPVIDDLLPIARRAVTEAGKATRQVVADAIRGQGLPLANDRLTGLMDQLRIEAVGQDTRPR
ncbi:DUF2637 domain-containing protein [Streptomyces sp. NPDC006512]|uniref:DUF2637 domain-containing protein n=1 Tax=Streptomyces sp. NPDC006512 TaxID=3154307 RepID=UPI0033AF5D77